MTTTSLKLHQVQVFPSKNGFENVIGLVRWAIEFHRNGCVSTAGVETLLDTSTLSSFVPIEQITKEQILSWAYQAQGGDAFVERVRPYHEEDLDAQEQRAGLVVYNNAPVDSVQVSNPALPASVL